MYYKEIILESIFKFGFALSLFFIVIPVTEANTASGWATAPAGEYLGQAYGCAAGESKRDYQLSVYNSSAIISNAQGLQVKTQVHAISTGALVKETAWYDNVTISPTICYNPLTESPRVIVRSSSNTAYQSYNGGGWRAPTTDIARKEIGTYQRGYAHLQPAGITPTITATYPVNQFVNNSRVGIIVSTADISPLYGATQIFRSFFSFWRNDVRTNLHTIVQGGGGWSPFL